MYKVVKFRLSVLSTVVAKLYNALVADGSEIHRYVHLKRAESGTCIEDSVEVDVNIITGYDDLTKDYKSRQVTVTREMVGELFDLLGLFPRAEERLITLAKVEPELQLVVGELDTIRDLTIELHDSGRSLKVVEEIMKAAGRARHNLTLLLGIIKVQ